MQALIEATFLAYLPDNVPGKRLAIISVAMSPDVAVELAQNENGVWQHKERWQELIGLIEQEVHDATDKGGE